MNFSSLAIPSELSKRFSTRGVLPVVEYVDFDANNPEHLRALRMLMEETPRQHPTLRFYFDSVNYRSAFTYMIDKVTEAHINRVLDSEVASVQSSSPPNLYPLRTFSGGE